MVRVLAFGEVLLRLATEKNNRLFDNSQLHANFGGSEANVGASLAQFGHEVSMASVLPNHQIGQAALRLLRSYNINTKHVQEVAGRMGAYYVESGAGNRGASVIYDRAGSAFATSSRSQFNLKALLKDVDVLFISGITPALSQNLQEITMELVQLAQQSGIKVAFDNNYRAKLWSSKQKAFEMTRSILPYVNYLSAGILDVRAILSDDRIIDLKDSYDRLQEKYPNLEVIYSTNRQTLAAEDYKLIGYLYRQGELYHTKEQSITNAVDRIGGGDAYSAGIIHGVVDEMSNQNIVDFALAATVLKHTVYGDMNQFDESEVTAFSHQQTGDVNR